MSCSLPHPPGQCQLLRGRPGPLDRQPVSQEKGGRPTGETWGNTAPRKVSSIARSLKKGHVLARIHRPVVLLSPSFLTPFRPLCPTSPLLLATNMSDEKLALPYGEYKAEQAHLEHAGGQVGAIVRPARVFSPEEEAKLYRKLDIKVSALRLSQCTSDLALTLIGPFLQLLPMLAVLYLLSFMICRFSRFEAFRS